MAPATKKPAEPVSTGKPAMTTGTTGTATSLTPVPTGKVPDAPAAAAAPAPVVPSFIPTSRTPMKTSFEELFILIYGMPKIGKSTFASKFPGALFLPTEPGLNHLSVFQAPADGTGIRSWEQLREILAQVSKGDHPFKTLVLDTADSAYRLCAEFICRTWNIRHLDDLPTKKGYSLCNAEFERVLRRMAHLPYGLVVTSHCQDREVKDKGTGVKYDKVVPTLTGGCHKIVAGLADMILFATTFAEPEDGSPAGDVVEGGAPPKMVWKRVLYTKPNLAYDAGDRTGTLPRQIELSFDAFAEAYSKGVAEKQKAGS